MKRIMIVTALISTILITSNLVLSQTELFKDDFDTSPLDVTNKWRIGDNSGSAVSIVSGLLQLNLIDAQAAWIVTQDAFPLSNTTVTVKILKATKDGSIGICPSYPKLKDYLGNNNTLGIDSEANWYRFYVGGSPSDPDAAPYKLYAFKKRQGIISNPKTIPLPSPFGNAGSPFYLQLRFDNSQIYFEYSTTGTNPGDWNLMHQEIFDLPAYSLNNAFHAEIAATDNSQNPGTLKVDDFKVVNNSATPTIARIILDDPLNNSTFVNRKTNPIASALKVDRSYVGSNMNFTASGWKPSGDLDLVVYDLGRYIEKGSLEIDVAQFEPARQNSMDRHHVLAMFRMPWGGHHPVEKLETIWDLHTGNGFGFNDGIKFYTNYYGNEVQTYVTNAISPWTKSLTYHLTIYWEPNQLTYRIRYLHDGVDRVTHFPNNETQLRYIYVGRDYTVSGDLTTGFNNNQYKTMRDVDGPIYFNVVAKELRSTEGLLPSISSFTTLDVYNNAARISWQTDENTVCYVKYGATTAYDQQTRMLGIPDISFTTLLTNLNSNQTYHYKVIAEDNAGNVSESSDQTFTTSNNGVYIFTSATDTYIERNRDGDTGAYSHLYGPTRALGNYGWMNLMTANGRYSYLKFQIPNSLSNIMPQTLRLYSRQGGQSGVNLYQFNPVSSNWESAVTWTNQSSVGGQSGDGFQNSNGGITGPLLGSIASPMNGNQWYSFNFTSPASVVSTVEVNNIVYYFALQGTGSTPPGSAQLIQDVSFDSRESTNNQPELIILPPAFTEISTILPNLSDGTVAWGDYDKDADLDILLTGDQGNSTVYSGVWKNNGNGVFDDAGLTILDNAGLEIPLQAVKKGVAIWGDYDKNNFLDILLTGENAAGSVKYIKVYQNQNNNTFLDISPLPLQALSKNGAVWGDYNNDRHVDLLLTGIVSGGGFTRLYKATSTGTWITPNPPHALQALRDADAAFGDYDEDGDLDILLGGNDNSGNSKVLVYKNLIYDNNTGPNSEGFQLMTPLITDFPGAPRPLAWGDYDNDGDLDIALPGAIYQRTPTGYFKKPFSIAMISDRGDIVWGDYDNDGDQDLLVTGTDNQSDLPISKVYRNKLEDGLRSFEDIAAPLLGLSNSAAAWGDYDKDGKLDILLSGIANGLRATKLYKNNASSANNAPSTPTSLSASISGSNVTLTWSAASDNETPNNADGLTYNIMVGVNAANTTGTVSPMALTSIGSQGFRLIPAMGNVYSGTSHTLLGLPVGTYHWKAQAVDNGFKGSAFSSDSEFAIGAAKTNAMTNLDSLAQQAIPQTFALSQGYPNPFNPTTRLNLNLPEDGFVKAIVYDLLGQEVARLQEATMKAGYKYLDWDGKNNAGTIVSSGAYLVKVIFDGATGLRQEATSRVALLK